MRVVHRISVASSSSLAASLSEVGVHVASAGLVTFEVDESDSSWRLVESWVRSYGAVDVASTVFSAEELTAAAQLEMVADWHHGYPQPERDFGYLHGTFDGGSCGVCGVGRCQVGPFQLTVCSACGQRKFAVSRRGFSPAPREPSGAELMARSRQWFGSGASAHREVIVARELRLALLPALNGASFRPCGPLLG